MATDDLDFPGPISLPVTIGKDKYTLREAPGGVAIEYRKRRNDCYESDPVNSELRRYKGSGLEETVTYLISGCLLDGENPLTEEQVLQKVPDKLRLKLFSKIREISGMDVEEETVESLTKERDALNKRIEELQKNGDQIKN